MLAAAAAAEIGESDDADLEADPNGIKWPLLAFGLTTREIGRMIVAKEVRNAECVSEGALKPSATSVR